ncbi:PTS cellobiose transporter subunit IIC [Exiguobacterium sp. Leaf187]|uniref:Permease IIC component n=2 Tax=Exiguobacterium TaxID=33986 RepID=A0A0V8GHX6_9BACL|nr:MULTISPECIES: PTS sugar transporter subunit IIC [Exiguobacterium]AHA30883.1 PTS cellobiose transporter subunit IIC [Exiguobacterium sp. MH3]AOS98879.1 PTS cellobiose transporter subunit IIC [Exiguobacterium sp. U13-1]KNH32367.1 PTS cellobiose transporter subunit IIC [Exiguobacterium acetylicum]KQS20147.1 PTS cellobiose transporter subunit IIC [Exiguobacterium sp. Leaf187]KSU49845.1 PTS cellobiose transporter subunit IIC [Exiguobacterium enclense]
MNRLETVFEKVTPAFARFANAKPVLAIKDGFILTMPMTIIGSLFLLILALPIPGWEKFMTGLFGADWTLPLTQVVGATFDILALIGVFGIAYSYVKNEKIEGVPAGILGIIAFLIITQSSVLSKSGEVVTGVVPKVWTGGQGVLASIVVGLVVGFIYSQFIKRGIRIKMPDGVPPGVSNSFSALIPGLAIITLSVVTFAVFQAFADRTFTEVVYDVLQAPIQNLTDTLAGAVLIMILMSVMWWCGIHGAAIIMGIMGPLLTANALQNQAIIDSGKELVVGDNAKIVTIQFLDVFTKLGGTGITVGFIIATLIVARSAHLKQLGKLSLAPSLFNINEPVIFGMPIVFNPIMFVPFVIVPAIASFMVYFSILWGWVEPFNALQVPWTTPPVISGFLISGWQGALLQLATIAMSVAIYLPFVRMQDQLSYGEELKAQEEHASA